MESDSLVEPASKPVVVLDIGGTKISAAVVEWTPLADPQFTICCSQTAPTNAPRGGTAVCATAVDLARSVAHQYAAAHGSSIVGISVASAGVVDEANGSIISATDLIPGWAGIELGRTLSQQLGLPTRVMNDVHAHALGEVSAGVARGCDSALVLGVGTGIGGAVVSHGHVLRGAHGLSGHLGHIHHPLANGFTCSCGRFGHIESVASGSGLGRLYNARVSDFQTERAHNEEYSISQLEGVVSGGRALKDLADAGNDLAQRTLSESGRALGEVLGSLANAFDPDVIILSGSVTRAGELWWNAIHEGYGAQAMDTVAHTPLLQGSLGDSAPLIGAAANYLIT
ncbi:ROK family protein [Changpingibacter yushuensis]|uniref:ROK family protein n=1 Tax=Changpingibacter yushuensis TaxID=2758440 RepID=UPI001FEA17B9|nr:ROK family protein [Changpingibacter yushuensis]